MVMVDEPSDIPIEVPNPPLNKQGMMLGVKPFES